MTNCCARLSKKQTWRSGIKPIIEFLAEFVHHGRTRITEGDFLQIHDLTIEGIYPCAGNYRNALTVVSITGTRHKPLHPSQVRTEVNDLLDWLHARGAKSALHRAAYALWRVNYIHPFNGGNGRVARSLAYLVMASEVAPIFAGESLPAKLKRRKEEYIQGLQIADGGNLQPLENLVLECFQQQIAELVAELISAKARH